MLTVKQYNLSNLDLMGYRSPDYIHIKISPPKANSAAVGRFMKGLGLFSFGPYLQTLLSLPLWAMNQEGHDLSEYCH